MYLLPSSGQLCNDLKTVTCKSQISLGVWHDFIYKFFPTILPCNLNPLFSSVWLNLSPTDSNGNAFEITVQNRQLLLVTTWLLVLSRARDMSSHHVKGVERNRTWISPDWTWSRDKAESYLPQGSAELLPVPRSPILLESPPSISPGGETITAPFCRNNFSVILFYKTLANLQISKSLKTILRRTFWLLMRKCILVLNSSTPSSQISKDAQQILLEWLQNK